METFGIIIGYAAAICMASFNFAYRLKPVTDCLLMQHK